MLAHATALVGFLVPVAGHIVGPLIVCLPNGQIHRKSTRTEKNR